MMWSSSVSIRWIVSYPVPEPVIYNKHFLVLHVSKTYDTYSTSIFVVSYLDEHMHVLLPVQRRPTGNASHYHTRIEYTNQGKNVQWRRCSILKSIKHSRTIGPRQGFLFGSWPRKMKWYGRSKVKSWVHHTRRIRSTLFCHETKHHGFNKTCLD